jgi:hypothetical protein
MRSKKTTVLPEAKVCRFDLDPGRGWYVKTAGPEAFYKVPEELRVESVVRQDKINASLLIRSHQRGGRYEFFTGLLPTKFPGVFFGDYFDRKADGSKINSLVLFVFSEGQKRLTIHFFNGYKVYPTRRAAFIESYLRALKTV